MTNPSLDSETAGLTSPFPLPSLFQSPTPHRLTAARSNNYCPTCRVHIPSRRALRDDPDFDKTVATLYANAPDYDRRENAYSAHVTKQSMAAEKQAREQERIAKKIRAEEAAKQAAEMREKYRAEAEIRARAKAEADAAAKAERDAAAAERAALAEAAAEAAAEETRRRIEREHSEAVERERRTLAAEEARREANGDDAMDDDASLEDDDREDRDSGEKRRGGGGDAETAVSGGTKKRARKSSGGRGGRGGRAKEEKEKKPSAAVPAFTSKPVQRGGVTVVEMPDDFAGLYAMRVADDKAKLTASERAERGSSSDAQIRTYAVELKRLSADGGVGCWASVLPRAGVRHRRRPSGSRGPPRFPRRPCACSARTRGRQRTRRVRQRRGRRARADPRGARISTPVLRRVIVIRQKIKRASRRRRTTAKLAAPRDR